MPLLFVYSDLYVLVVENVFHETKLVIAYSVLDTLKPVKIVAEVRKGNFVKASKKAIWNSS
jgi:hypothetical protein